MLYAVEKLRPEAWGPPNLGRRRNTISDARERHWQMIVTAPAPLCVTPVIGSQGRKLSLKQNRCRRSGDRRCLSRGGCVAPRTGPPCRPIAAARAPSAAIWPMPPSLFPSISAIAAGILRSWTGIEGNGGRRAAGDRGERAHPRSRPCFRLFRATDSHSHR